MLGWSSAGAVAGCGLACAARLPTAAWAVTEAIILELEAQETQKEMLMVLLYAEGSEELIFGCWCGAGRVARAAARVGGGRC